MNLFLSTLVLLPTFISKTTPDGVIIQVNEGVLKEDEISYSIDVMGSSLKVKDKVMGNLMKLTVTLDGNEIPFELKKEEKE